MQLAEKQTIIERIKKWSKKDKVLGVILIVLGLIIVGLALWILALSNKKCPPTLLADGYTLAEQQKKSGSEAILAIMLIFGGLAIGGMGGGLITGQGVGMLFR